VTVVAATATDAEVWAKALFITGSEGAEREANATATPALLVTLDGRRIFAGGLA
jgi:thiamine biosynthesis lipoprotein ApbE